MKHLTTFKLFESELNTNLPNKSTEEFEECECCDGTGEEPCECCENTGCTDPNCNICGGCGISDCRSCNGGISGILPATNEGKALKATKKPFKGEKGKVWDEDKKEAFRKKVEDLVKSQGCTTKKIGDDFEVHYDKKHIAQVMFRDDYVGVKKQGVKFIDEFEYTELGKIKSKLSEIVKSCK